MRIHSRHTARTNLALNPIRILESVTTPRVSANADEQLADRLARLQQRRPSSRRTRRHPAAGARATALVLSLVSAGGLGALFAHLNTAQASTQGVAALPTPLPVAGATTSTTAASRPGSTTSTTAAAAIATAQAFNGSLIQTKYGPVEVQAQISNGTIADIAVITYPVDDGKSRFINARALPQLRTEVLTAQQANVDTVSGATYTSNAYRQSLQAALDAARAAGATSIA
jgi:uncharacterized protein with FMN-binding domain